MLVPCGRCIMCKRAKAQEWAIRLKHELVYYQDCALFITLTYDSMNLPLYMDKNQKIWDVLSLSDTTKFIKRLRKRFTDRNIKYYYCGEYGRKNGRPHYHFILYGLRWSDMECYTIRIKDCKEVKSSKVIDKIWKYGENQIGLVTEKSINYVTGYVIDKILDKRVHIIKPFAKMSKGLGFRFAEKYADKLKEDKYIKIDGKKLTIPRYYTRKLEIDMEKVSLQKLVEQYKKLYGMEESLNISIHDLIKLTKLSQKQVEEEYRAKRLLAVEDKSL